jgi:hypothetical protein
MVCETASAPPDGALDIIESCHAGCAPLLARALALIFPDAGASAVASPLLTRSGSPVELAFCWPNRSPRLTADAAPGASADIRWRRTLELVGGFDDPALSAAVAVLEEWQRTHQPKYGAWLGVRQSGGDSVFKVYAEVPDQAPWARWESEMVGVPPILPSRDVRLRMVGLEPRTGTIELYYSARMLFTGELDTLMRRAQLPARGAEMIALLQMLTGRTIDREIPSADLGFSYSFTPGSRVFTLYSFAHSLLGGDGAIRRSLLSVCRRRGWDARAYEQVSSPAADGRGPRTWHGMIGLMAESAGPIRMTVGIAPPEARS